jgi:protein TonB
MGIETSGAGTGNGYGSGRNPGSPVMQLTQVSFRHAPPPEYPDAARKDGKEGRVLLRVLVDEEGKSKLVEINLSSGSQVLDHAAAEAIKRWRFSPARYGDSPTASWVKIPVDFRLKEAK